MHPLETSYLNQAGPGLSSAPGIGPIYSAPLYLQRGHGISSFFGTLFCFVRPLLWTVGRTGGKIITDIAKNKSPDVSAEDIISKHVGDVVSVSPVVYSANCVVEASNVSGRRNGEAKSLKRHRQSVPVL